MVNDALTAGAIDATSAAHVTCGAATECQTDMHDLITVRYDEADKCLDMLEFVMCALAAMESTYSDRVTNGCVSTINDAVATLREYIGDAREALLGATKGTAKWVRAACDALDAEGVA